MNDLISIIIPTYNRCQSLIKTINSLLKNENAEYEIIIVDDGSTDNTRIEIQKLNSYKIKYFWINNSERGAARNYGAKKAKGSYLNFFDSDDIAYINHIKTAAKIIANNKKINVFHLSYEVINLKKNRIIKYINSGNTNSNILNGNCISCNSLFIKKDIFLKFKFDENRLLSGSEDWDLWLRLSRFYKIYNYKDITSALIDHDNRSMNENNIDKISKRLEILKNKVQKKEYKDLSKKETNKILSHIYSFECLHYSFITKKNKKFMINLFIKSLSLYPFNFFQLRSILIIKNIFFKW